RGGGGGGAGTGGGGAGAGGDGVGGGLGRWPGPRGGPSLAGFVGGRTAMTPPVKTTAPTVNRAVKAARPRRLRTFRNSALTSLAAAVPGRGRAGPAAGLIVIVLMPQPLPGTCG